MSAEVKKQRQKHARVKHGVCTTTSSIGHGLHASDVACAHQLGDIDRGMHVSTTKDDISHVLLPSDVRVGK